MLGGRMVGVGISRGRFVGGRNVKAPHVRIRDLPSPRETLPVTVGCYLMGGRGLKNTNENYFDVNAGSN